MCDLNYDVITYCISICAMAKRENMYLFTKKNF